MRLVLSIAVIAAVVLSSANGAGARFRGAKQEPAAEAAPVEAAAAPAESKHVVLEPPTVHVHTTTTVVSAPNLHDEAVGSPNDITISASGSGPGAASAGNVAPACENGVCAPGAAPQAAETVPVEAVAPAAVAESTPVMSAVSHPGGVITEGFATGAQEQAAAAQESEAAPQNEHIMKSAAAVEKLANALENAKGLLGDDHEESAPHAEEAAAAEAGQASEAQDEAHEGGKIAVVNGDRIAHVEEDAEGGLVLEHTPSANDKRPIVLNIHTHVVEKAAEPAPEEKPASEEDPVKSAEEKAAQIIKEAEEKAAEIQKDAEGKAAEAQKEEEEAKEAAAEEEKAMEEKKAEMDKKLEEEEKAADEKLAEEEKAADEKLEEEKKATEEKLAEEEKASDEKLEEEKKESEDKLEEEKKATEEKLAEEEKEADAKLAEEEKEADAKLAEEAAVANHTAAAEPEHAEPPAAVEAASNHTEAAPEHAAEEAAPEHPAEEAAPEHAAEEAAPEHPAEQAAPANHTEAVHEPAVSVEEVETDAAKEADAISQEIAGNVEESMRFVERLRDDPVATKETNYPSSLKRIFSKIASDRAPSPAPEPVAPEQAASGVAPEQAAQPSPEPVAASPEPSPSPSSIPPTPSPVIYATGYAQGVGGIETVHRYDAGVVVSPSDHQIYSAPVDPAYTSAMAAVCSAASSCHTCVLLSSCEWCSGQCVSAGSEAAARDTCAVLGEWGRVDSHSGRPITAASVCRDYAHSKAVAQAIPVPADSALAHGCACPAAAQPAAVEGQTAEQQVEHEIEAIEAAETVGPACDCAVEKPQPVVDEPAGQPVESEVLQEEAAVEHQEAANATASAQGEETVDAIEEALHGADAVVQVIKRPKKKQHSDEVKQPTMAPIIVQGPNGQPMALVPLPTVPFGTPCEDANGDMLDDRDGAPCAEATLTPDEVAAAEESAKLEAQPNEQVESASSAAPEFQGDAAAHAEITHQEGNVKHLTVHTRGYAKRGRAHAHANVTAHVMVRVEPPENANAEMTPEALEEAAQSFRETAGSGHPVSLFPMTEPLYMFDQSGMPVSVIQQASPLGGLPMAAMIPLTPGRASSDAHAQALASLQWARFRTLRAYARQNDTSASPSANETVEAEEAVAQPAPAPMDPLDAAVLEAEGELRGAHVAAALARRVAKREAEAETGVSNEMKRKMMALRDARRKVEGMVSGIAVALDLEETQAMDAQSAQESGEADRVELQDPTLAAEEREMAPAEIELRASQAKSLGIHLDELAEAKRHVEKELAVLAAFERKRTAALDDLQQEVILVNEALVKYGRARSAQLSRDLVQAASTLKRAHEVSAMTTADSDQATIGRREAEKALREADRQLDSVRSSAAKAAEAGEDSATKVSEARTAVIAAEDALRVAAHREDAMHLRNVHAHKAVVLSMDAQQQMKVELAEIEHKVEFAERMLSGEPEPAPAEAATEAGAEGAASAVAAEAASEAGSEEHAVVTLQEVDDDLRLADGAADKALEVLKRLEKLAHAAHKQVAASAAAEAEGGEHAAEAEHAHHEETHETPKFRETSSRSVASSPAAPVVAARRQAPLAPRQVESDQGFDALMSRVLGHSSLKADGDIAEAAAGYSEFLQVHAGAMRSALLARRSLSRRHRRQDGNGTEVVAESSSSSNSTHSELDQIEQAKMEAAKSKAEAELEKMRAEADAAKSEALAALASANASKIEADMAEQRAEAAKNETLSMVAQEEQANATAAAEPSPEPVKQEEEHKEEAPQNASLPVAPVLPTREEVMNLATSVAEKAAAEASSKAAKIAAEEAAKQAAERAAEMAADKASSKAAEKAAKLAAQEAAEKASELASEKAAKQATELATEANRQSHAEAANQAAQGVLDAVAQKLGRPMPRMGGKKGDEAATLDNVADALVASGTGPQPSVDEIRTALDALKDSDFTPTEGHVPPAMLDDALPAVMHAAVGAAADHKAEEAAEVAKEAEANGEAAVRLRQEDIGRIGAEEALAAAANKRFVSPDAHAEGGCRNKLAAAHSALGKSQHALSLAILAESDSERKLQSLTGGVFTPDGAPSHASPHATGDLGSVGATGPMTSQDLRSRRQTVARARSAVARARDVLERLRVDCPDLTRPGEAEVMDAADDTGMAVAGGDLIQRHVDLQGHQYFAMTVSPDLATQKQRQEAAQLASDIASAANQMHQAREALAQQQQALSEQMSALHNGAAAAGQAAGDAAAGAAGGCGAAACAPTAMAPHAVVPVRTFTNATTTTEQHEDINSDGSSTKTHTHHHHVSTEIILPLPAAPVAAPQHPSHPQPAGAPSEPLADYRVPKLVPHASHNAGQQPLPAAEASQHPPSSSFLQEQAGRSKAKMTVSKALHLLHQLNRAADKSKHSSIPIHGDARDTGIVVEAAVSGEDSSLDRALALAKVAAPHQAASSSARHEHHQQRLALEGQAGAQLTAAAKDVNAVTAKTSEAVAMAAASAAAAVGSPQQAMSQLQNQLQEARLERDEAIKMAAKAQLAAQQTVKQDIASAAKSAPSDQSPAAQLRAARFAMMHERNTETLRVLNQERRRLGLPEVSGGEEGAIADTMMGEAAAAPAPQMQGDSAAMIGADDARLKEVSNALQVGQSSQILDAARADAEKEDESRRQATLEAARAAGSSEQNQAIRDVAELASAYNAPSSKVLRDMPRPSRAGLDSMDAYTEAQRYMQKMSDAQQDSIMLAQDQEQEDASYGERLSHEMGLPGTGAAGSVNAMQVTSQLAHGQAVQALQEAAAIQDRYAQDAFRFATQHSPSMINPVAEVGGTARAIEDANPPESAITEAGRQARATNPSLRGYVPLSKMAPAPPGPLSQEAAAFASANDPEIIAAAQANP